LNKNIFILIFSGFCTISTFSQKDTSKIKLLGDEKKILTITAPIKAIDTDKKILPTNEIKVDNNTKITKEAISNSILKNKTEPIKQFVLEQPTREKDIVVKKNWMGKDVTDKKIESTISLGNVNTKSKRVKIEFRDFGLIDGDRIQIYLNENVIKQNVVLSGNYFFIYINLEPGFNRIDFQALNEGTVGPNTAELIVYDESGTIISSKEWNLPTGAIATLGVFKK
jgi:hypothetical protein